MDKYTDLTEKQKEWYETILIKRIDEWHYRGRDLFSHLHNLTMRDVKFMQDIIDEYSDPKPQIETQYGC